MRDRLHRVLPFLLLAAGGGVASATPALPLGTGGLDLNVLVDQSSSVSRHALRRQLVSSAAEVVARSAAPSQVRHRFGVVSFGSSAHIDLPWTELGLDQLAAVRRGVKAIPFEEGSATTDFLAAFATAAEMFASLPAAPERRRAILLITDGVPDVPGVEAASSLRQVERFVASRFADPPTVIEVALLGSPSNASWRRHRDVWARLSHGRLTALHGGTSAMIAAHLTALGKLVEAPIVESRSMVSDREETYESLILPPYLESVVFDIVGEEPGFEVEILDPEVRRGSLSSASKGVEEARLGQVMRTVVVRRPEPGLWRFRKPRPGARVKILSQQFFPRGELATPARGEPLRQHERLTIAYRVADPSGFPLAELQRYPVSVSLTLVKPDGSRRRLAMTRGSKPRSEAFRAVEEVDCDLAGRYWTEVEVLTRDLVRNPISLFRDRWSGFMVSRATLIDCRLLTPQPGASLPVRSALWSGGMATRLECVHGTRPFAMERIAGPTPQAVFRPNLLREGEPAATTLDLEYRGEGVFDGWLHGVERSGAYRLRLDINRARVDPGFNVRLLPADVRFARRQTWQYRLDILALGAGIVLSLVYGRAVWGRWKRSGRGSRTATGRCRMNRADRPCLLGVIAITLSSNQSLGDTVELAEEGTEPSTD